MTAKAEKKLAEQLAEKQLLIQIKKDTLAREEALDQITLSKIKDKWFETLIDTKVPQMQDNLRHILHYMEKLIEAENFRKLLFEDERQELEEKSTLLAKSHGSALQTLFDIYQRRILYFKDVYNELVSEQKTRAEAEFKIIDDTEKMAQDNMNMILFQMQTNEKKKEENMDCEMRLMIEDEHSKNKELFESLQTKLEKKMENTWGKITSTLNRYEETTQERRKHYIKLKTKDDLDSKIIYQQTKKMQKIFEQLDELEKSSEECYAPDDSVLSINDLREERMKFFNAFKQLKLTVAAEIKEDEINLRNLTAITNELISNMKKTCSKGEQILTMFRICRKFETEYEKVVPVGNPLEISKVQLLKQKRKPTKSKKKKKEQENTTETEKQDSWIEDLKSDIEIFEKFWRRVGKIRLSILALEKCLDSSQKKNQILKRILASYLKEVAKTDKHFAF